MHTIILPGFSLKNKLWAQEAQKHLPSSVVHEWKHWETKNNGDFNAKNEAKSVLEKINTQANILAKSAGTIVVMYMLKDFAEKLNKLILCGIPINWENMDSISRQAYEILKDFREEKLLVIQNTNDPYAKYDLVRSNIAKINPKIKVIEKPRNDHEYPYWDDFNGFLV